MTVCKYMTGARGLGYLSNGNLRITPPSEFNDPFELKPPANNVYRPEDTARKLKSLDIEQVIDSIAEQMSPRFFPQLAPPQVRILVAGVIPGAEVGAEERAKKMLRKKMPQFTREKYVGLRKHMADTWPELIAGVERQMNEKLPGLNETVQKNITEKLPATLGVLCLSRDNNNPLMWSHYADCHRGVVLEFDQSHPSLNRRDTGNKNYGSLLPVNYSRLRPEFNLTVVEEERGFEVFALTKSSHWAYEEEMRLVLPLMSADRVESTPSGSVSLISIPPEALVAVTLGCKSPQALLDDVLRVLADNKAYADVRVQRARMHETEFELVYEPAT